MICMALFTDRLTEWSRIHPLIDGALLGPFLGLPLLFLRWNGWLSIPYIWILAVTLAGVGIGILLGVRRKRRLEATSGG
jgi:hypothetical protein